MSCRRVSLCLSLLLVAGMLFGCNPETDVPEAPASELDGEQGSSDDGTTSSGEAEPEVRFGTPIPADFRLSERFFQDLTG